MSPNANEKVTSALVLSSLAFVVIVLFVILWPFRKKILLIGKPVIERCFKWTQKELKKTRKKLSENLKKSGLSTHAVDKTLKAVENPDEPHVYATIKKDRKDEVQGRSPSCTSNDSDFSASDNVIDETRVVSVELHAYQKVNLEPREKSAVSLKEVRLCETHELLDNNDRHMIDETSGSRIYDEIPRDERKSPCV